MTCNQGQHAGSLGCHVTQVSRQNVGQGGGSNHRLSVLKSSKLRELGSMVFNLVFK